MSDRILVNSQFTRDIFYGSFKRLQSEPVEVLYPAINFSQYDSVAPANTLDGIVPDNWRHVILSVNRFERKKNLPLALYALAQLREKLGSEFRDIGLVYAGGHDERVRENVEHANELQRIAKQLGLEDHVCFVKSFTDVQRSALLNRCDCVVYTPTGVCSLVE